MMKSQENDAKKLVFRAYFRHFRREIFFSKIGLRHILGIAILHLCAKKTEESNESISRKAGNRRTDERTDEHGLI